MNNKGGLPFWEKHNCPNCEQKLHECKCDLNYCPFCDAKFGFVQDWNVHLIKNHQKELQPHDNVEVKE